jgi:DNA repair photolyase
MEKTNEKDIKTVTKQEKTPDSSATAEDSLVIEAYEYVKGIFVHHFQNAMLETGQYLIEKFYNGDYQIAQEKKFSKNKSLLQLFSKIQRDNTGNVPGKTWLYDSINLAIDENKYKELYAYGNLGHSHKVKLTNTSILPEDTKVNLIEEAVEKKYSVVVLQERIVQEKQKLNGTQVSLTEDLKPETLKSLTFEKLTTIKNQTESRFVKAATEMALYKGNIKKINIALKVALKNKKGKNKKVTGFKEWTSKSINICRGCPNDCKYCFAKSMAYKFKQVEEGQWNNEIIRQNDVDKKYKLYKGTIGFPTSHDITPTNIDAYVQVLKKLLDFKNEMLIVSKPNLECIKRICDETADYKDKILFRFSIGSSNDNILRFWDTNAPLYEERKESLKYAFDNGFQTSVSMEPLLDSANVVATVADLVDYVTDFIWIGKMNYTKSLKKKAEVNNDQPLIEAIKVIEDGQTDEKIKAIYADFQKSPELFKKIKWKDSFKKVLGIESPEEAGMDI